MPGVLPRHILFPEIFWYRAFGGRLFKGTHQAAACERQGSRYKSAYYSRKYYSSVY